MNQPPRPSTSGADQTAPHGLISVSVKDFGPVMRGTVEIKPLTILIGPNNCGKSHVARLFGALQRTTDRKLSGLPYLMTSGQLRQSGVEFPSRELVKDLGTVRNNLEQLSESSEMDLPPYIVERILGEYLAYLFTFSMGNELRRWYGAATGELARIGKTKFGLTFDLVETAVDLEFSAGKLRVRSKPDLSACVKKQRVRLIKGYKAQPYSEHTSREFTEYVDHNPVVSFEVQHCRSDDQWRTESNKLIDFVLFRFHGEIFYHLKAAGFNCHYLPAGRSALMHFHKEIAASLVRRGAYPPPEQPEPSAHSAPEVEMVVSMIELPNRRNPYYELAEEFEKEALKGHVVAVEGVDRAAPEFRFEFRNGRGSIPAVRASSSVSELAPLIVYLKHIIDKFDLLIIEEPEVHLHPANQRLLAKLLVRLVNEGLHVIITTHSDILLEQLNHFFMLSHVPADRRAQMAGLAGQDALAPEFVSAYLFEFDGRSQGYRITQVEKDEDEGISEKEFMRIQEQMYEELIRIRQEAAGQNQLSQS